MQQYHDFLEHILNNGEIKGDRTGTGTISAVVPPQMRFDLSKGFPMVNTKYLPFDLIARELKWFTKGDTNIEYLLEHNVNIWNGDAYRYYTERGGKKTKKEYINAVRTDSIFAKIYGELGPIYGKQWRDWKVGGESIASVDQLRIIIEQIEEVKSGNFKNARRLIVSAWNAGALIFMALPPCHVLMQFFVVGNKLSCHLYQRSGDSFLGVPFNIASYSLLTHIIALETGLEVGEFIHTVGDAHIYLNHLDQVKEQLSRTPYDLPELAVKRKMHLSIDNWEPEDFQLVNYKYHPAIKGELSV